MLFEIMLLKGTSAGSAARISRVGASNFGVTSTNLQLPWKGSLTRSSGSADLNAHPHTIAATGDGMLTSGQQCSSQFNVVDVDNIHTVAGQSSSITASNTLLNTTRCTKSLAERMLR